MSRKDANWTHLPKPCAYVLMSKGKVLYIGVSRYGEGHIHTDLHWTCAYESTVLKLTDTTLHQTFDSLGEAEAYAEELVSLCRPRFKGNDNA